MPKIYEYLGYVFLIYTDDHPPIHVHVQHGEYQAKVELLYHDGALTLKFKKIRGIKLLTAKHQNEVERFVKEYANGIVEKWTQIHVYRTTIKAEKINRRL